MSVTVYREPGWSGIYAQLAPGLTGGKDLVGCAHQSSSCEEFEGQIASMRVDPNTLVAVSANSGITGSQGGTRVVMGPADVADITAELGLKQVRGVLVIPFRAYDSAIPAPGSGVQIFDAYGFQGRRSLLRRGDYAAARLASDSVRMPPASIQSLQVDAHTVCVAYTGDNFDRDRDAAVFVGPVLIDDLDRYGLTGRIRSIRVHYTDPFDTPGRARLPLGTGRDYIPGAGGLSGGSLGPDHRRGRPGGALRRLWKEAQRDAPVTPVPLAATEPTPGWALSPDLIMILFMLLVITALFCALVRNRIAHGMASVATVTVDPTTGLTPSV